MSLKTRVAILEEKFNIMHEEMPEGLSPQDQYLWLIRQPLPRTSPSKEPPDLSTTPEQAYAAMIESTKGVVPIKV
jgi:hypothetical protein